MPVGVIFSCIFSILFGRNLAGSASDIASDYILNALNKDAKPCDDPFNFICGKWLQSLPKTDNDSNNYFFETERIQNETRKIILSGLNAIDVKDKTTPQYKIWFRTYYDQCLQNSISANETVKQVFNGLQRMIGPPPLLTTNKTVYDVLVKRNVWNLLGHLQRKLAQGVFFSTSVENVKNDCGKMVPILTFKPPYLYEEADEELNATEIIISVNIVANLFQVTIDPTVLQTKVDNVVKMHNDFVQYINDSSDISAEVYYQIYEYMLLNSTDDLNAVNPKIDWTEFLKGLFSTQLDDWDLNSAKFQMRHKKFFQNIDDIVAKYDTETVFNYMFYKSMKTMYKLAIVKDDDFNADPVGKCVEATQNAYGPVAAKLYFEVTKQDPMQWSSDTTIIADNVLTSFKYLVTKQDWLTTQQKAAIFKKVNSIMFETPLPEWLSSDEKVEKRSIKFEPDKGVYDNAANVAKWMFHLELDRLITGDTSDNDINFYPWTSYSSENIAFSFGSILPPFYHYEYPTAMKYGIFGNKIAENLLQGFNKDYVEEWLGENSAWFSDSDLAQLDDEILCLDKQITDIECKVTPDKCVDKGYVWNYTVNMLLSQIDAVYVTYDAYKQDSANDKDTNQLKGLTDYSWDQIYLLSRGRSFCNSYNTDSDDEGGNSTTQSRLLKVFRNVQLYATNFKCSSGSQAVVAKPCSLWT